MMFGLIFIRFFLCGVLLRLDFVLSQYNNQLDQGRFDGLQSHNAYRRMHGVGNLVLDEEINNFSQKYAEELARTGRFEHSNNKKYGENLAVSCKQFSSYGLVADDAVKRWYDEINLYDFNKQGFHSDTGHFTQVVWKGSEKLGIGIAKGRYMNYDGCYYVVANYFPPGNYLYRFESNVFRPIQQNKMENNENLVKPKVVYKNIVFSNQQKNPIELAREVGLKLHNKYRKAHHVPNLELDDNLNGIAQNYAYFLLTSRPKQLMRSTNNNIFGENLYSYCGRKDIPLNYTAVITKAVNSWYNQIRNYDFHKPRYTSSASYFTQLIWKNSEKLGLGIAGTVDSPCLYVVANYNAKGNIRNEFEENVLEKKRDKNDQCNN